MASEELISAYVMSRWGVYVVGGVGGETGSRWGVAGREGCQWKGGLGAGVNRGGGGGGGARAPVLTRP